MELPSAVNIVVNYLKQIETMRRKSTAEMYEWHLIEYFKYLKSLHKSLHESTSEDIISYLGNKNDWSSVTKNHSMSILKGFYQYYINKIPVGLSNDELRFRLTREAHVREIQMLSQYKKVSILKQKALTLNEIKKLLEYSKKYNYNHFCFFYVFLWFGFRKNEFRQLKINKNVFWNENKLLITADISKTNTDRVLYFSEYVKEILLHLNKKYGNEQKLVVIDISFLNKLFARYDKIVGHHIYPHSFRHTWNSEMQKSLKNKLAINEDTVIKFLIGHSQGMTFHYTSIDIVKEESKKAMLNYHYLFLL